MPKLSHSRYRSRTISFRLTSSEYEEVVSACANCGGHSLSEFARAVLLEFAGSGAQGSIFQNRLTVLDQRIASLDSTFGRLADRLESLGGRNPSNDDDGAGSGAPDGATARAGSSAARKE